MRVWRDGDHLHVGGFSFVSESVDAEWHAMTHLDGYVRDGWSRRRWIAYLKATYNAVLAGAARRLEWS